MYGYEIYNTKAVNVTSTESVTDNFSESSRPKYFSNIIPRKKHPVIVFLCTPRCGTQWLAKNLSEIYSDEAVTLHEPTGGDYNLRVNLGVEDVSVENWESRKLNKHFTFIEEVTQDKSYIEVAWQSIAIIPEFYKRFGNRLKVIHLYRNPVNVAASLVTHKWYTGRVGVAERSAKSELTPFDDGATLEEYRDRWEELTYFEKSLYYWTEINLQATGIKHRYNNIPFYSLKFENLFQGNKEASRITLLELLSFMDLKYKPQMLDALNVPHDNYQFRSLYKIDSKNFFKHPQTLALANKLGYKSDKKIDLSRYKKRSLLKKATRKVKQYLPFRNRLSR